MKHKRSGAGFILGIAVLVIVLYIAALLSGVE